MSDASTQAVRDAEEAARLDGIELSKLSTVITASTPTIQDSFTVQSFTRIEQWEPAPMFRLKADPRFGKPHILQQAEVDRWRRLRRWVVVQTVTSDAPDEETYG